MAKDLENNIIAADYYDWAGLDHFTSPLLVKDNKLYQSVNFTSNLIAGGKRTRQPYALWLDNPDNQPVRNLIFFTYFNSDGTSTSYAIRISGENMYAANLTAGAVSWGNPVLGFQCSDTTTPFAYAVLLNELHLSNGTDIYQVWDPIDGWDTFATAPKARCMTTFYRRIFCSNVPGAPSREYFSSVDFVGAPSEFTNFNQDYNAGVTSIQISTNQGFATVPANTDQPKLDYHVILGVNTANEEDVIVSEISGGPNPPWTLTLDQPTTKSHSNGDIIQNNEPWYSDNNDSSSANYFDVDNGHNGTIIANDVVNNNLTMHKGNGGLYVYNGNSISNPLQAGNPYFNSPGQSSVSPYCLDQIGGIEFYMDRDGVYAFDGGFPKNISYEVLDYIQNMSGSQYPIAPAKAFQNKYYLAIGTTTDQYGYTVKNCILTYDLILNLWETHSFANMPTVFETIVDTNLNQQLVFGDAEGNTYMWNTGVGDNGLPQTAIIQTPYLTFGAVEKTKDILAYSISTNPGANFQFQYSTDFSNQWTTLTSTSGMGVSDNAPIGMKNFKSIAFRLTANTIVPMIFYGFTLKVNVGTKRVAGRRI